MVMLGADASGSAAECGAAAPLNEVVTAHSGRTSLARLPGSGADNQDQAFFA